MNIAFPDRRLFRTYHRLLSQLMVAALLAGCDEPRYGKLSEGLDTNRSYEVLVTGGLIVGKRVIVNGQTEFIWEVTDKAIEKLKALGIEVPC